MLEASQQIHVVQTIVVPDDLLHIRATVRNVATSVDLVISTGGTGLGARDVTPEALTPLLHRPTPGITHGIMSASLTNTPLGSLSRGVSGIFDQPPATQDRSPGDVPTHSTLIITLPGSPKAVRECTDWLLGTKPAVLLHALKLVVRDRAVEGEHRQMQGSLARSLVAPPTTTPAAAAAAAATSADETNASSAPSVPTGRPGCGCDHEGTGARAGEYVSAYPGAPQDRQRVSPWPVVSLDKALAEIDLHVSPLCGTETARVDSNLVGRILAEDVVAPYDLPPRPTSNMDG